MNCIKQAYELEMRLQIYNRTNNRKENGQFNYSYL